MLKPHMEKYTSACSREINKYKELSDYYDGTSIMIPVSVYNNSQVLIDQVYDLLKTPDFENNRGDLVHFSMTVRPVIDENDEMVDGVVIRPTVVCIEF